MNRKNLKNAIISVNYPLIVLLGYAIHCIESSASFQDSIVIAVLATLSFANYYTKEFFRLKEMVISENDFRKVVSSDISDIKQKIATINLQTNGNPFKRK